MLVLLIAGGSGAALYFTSDGYKIGKNEKLAAECMDAGEYKDAISYYKEVLKLDASLVDVYESMAEAYLGMEKEDKALEVLQDGLKACKKDEEAKAKLTAKQVEIYSGQIDRSLEAGNYQEAYTLITAAYEETGAQELLAKRADVYQAESTAYQNSRRLCCRQRSITAGNRRNRRRSVEESVGAVISGRGRFCCSGCRL